MASILPSAGRQELKARPSLRLRAFARDYSRKGAEPACGRQDAKRFFIEARYTKDGRNTMEINRARNERQEIRLIG